MAIQTKRQYVHLLYSDFQKEINVFELTNIDKLFPKVEDLDIPELIFLFTTYFMNLENWENNVKMLLLVNNIKISELFYSIQGEGRYMGVPSVFLRTFGCNFKCDGFGMPKGELSVERFKIDADTIKEYKKLVENLLN